MANKEIPVDTIGAHELRAAITDPGASASKEIEEQRLAVEIAERLFKEQEQKRILMQAFDCWLHKTRRECVNQMSKWLFTMIFAGFILLMLWWEFRKK